jgi:hypothetical protein
MSAMVRHPRVCLELKISCCPVKRRGIGAFVVKKDAQDKFENIKS